MREIMCLVVLAGSAMSISSIANGFNETYKKIDEIEARIERMKNNPRPEYDHYPNPTASELPGELETRD